MAQMLGQQVRSAILPKPVGRFAPSPTGALHLGSLTTAVASFCHIKSLGGEWLLRIEDVDFERCRPQFSDKILSDLEALGLFWDRSVVYQSQRIELYRQYLFEGLAPWIYACTCSRKSLAQYHAQQRNLSLSQNTPHFSHSSQVSQSLKSPALKLPETYPRICLGKNLPFDNHKIRLCMPDIAMGFFDGIQGVQWSNPQKTLGDMVVLRQNGMINYILAACVDDGLQKITHIMRGLDILPMTCAQISIAQCLNLPSAQHWYHLPLVHNPAGQKLSKQNLAQAIDTRLPSILLQNVLTLLKQPQVDLDTPDRMLKQAIAQWDNGNLLGLKSL